MPLPTSAIAARPGCRPAGGCEPTGRVGPSPRPPTAVHHSPWPAAPPRRRLRPPARRGGWRSAIRRLPRVRGHLTDWRPIPGRSPVRRHGGPPSPGPGRPHRPCPGGTTTATSVTVVGVGVGAIALVAGDPQQQALADGAHERLAGVDQCQRGGHARGGGGDGAAGGPGGTAQGLGGQVAQLAQAADHDPLRARRVPPVPAPRPRGPGSLPFAGPGPRRGPSSASASAVPGGVKAPRKTPTTSVSASSGTDVNGGHRRQLGAGECTT